MLTAQFFGLNVHFAANLFAALVSFAVCWLIFDAWSARRSRHDFLKGIGFAVLAAGFLLTAALVPNAWTVSAFLATLAMASKLVGYSLIALGLAIDPLQPVPDVAPDQALAELDAAPAQPKSAKSTKHHAAHLAAIPLWPGLMVPPLALAVAAAAGVVALLYWRRAGAGLERHLRPVGVAFAILMVAELLAAVSASSAGTNPLLEQAVRLYGPVWWLWQAVLVLAMLVLGRWVWNYLTKRLLSQLFISLVGLTMLVFFVSAISFSYLMLRDLRQTQLKDLVTAARVLQYAVTSRQDETIAQAGAAAGAAGVATSIAAGDTAGVSKALSAYYTDRQLTSLTVTDVSGVVLWRAHDPGRRGDARSADPLIRRAVVGQPASDVLVSSGVTAPTITLTATSPVRDAAGSIIGTVTVGRAISSAFVERLEKSTGLASTVYGDNLQAASTLNGPNGKTTLGLAQSNSTVLETVLRKGQTFSGDVTIQNRQYLAAITPLVNVTNEPVGMLQAARPTSELFAAAAHSLQLTFLGAALLILLAAWPMYRLSAFIERQLR